MVKIVIRNPADIGALIKDRRRALRLDQAGLAERVGVSRLWINQVERGKPGASVGLVFRALASLGVELTWTSIAAPADNRDKAAVTGPDINAVMTAARRKDKR